MKATHPSAQWKKDQAAEIARALDLAEIKDPIIKGFLTRRFLHLVTMSFYDGVIADMESMIKAAETTTKKKGGAK